MNIAREIGNVKCANSVILGALSVVLVDSYLQGDDKMDFDRAFEEAIIDSFNNKPEVIKQNLYAFYEGQKTGQNVSNMVFPEISTKRPMMMR